MNENQRAALIETYFTAIDEDDFETLQPAVSEDVQFRSSAGVIDGVDELRAYLTNDRMFSNSVHDITRLVHHPEVSVCEGSVTGETPDGRVDAAFCDVFEFSPDDESIRSISVYTRS